jgi:hypothetical protein
MAKSCSCNDFTRSQLLRRGVAVAGKGLPKIESGMPLPAGTGLDRRTFLLRTAGAALSVYGASMLSPRHFEEGIAQAVAAGSPDQPVLVSIFMEGGWDALSVLAPVGEAKYKELRPVLICRVVCQVGVFDRVRVAGGLGWSGGRDAGLGVGVASLMMRGLGTPGPGFVLPACAV